MTKEQEQKIRAQVEFEVAVERIKYRGEYLAEKYTEIEQDAKKVEDTLLRYSGMAGRYSAIIRGMGEELVELSEKLEKLRKYYKEIEDGKK